jgi:hypothetical protein
MTTVTITGADDATPIDRMVDLSEQFPFLEWGILVSDSRAGTPRYPSPGWVRALKRQDLPLSAHLCGGVARSIMAGTTAMAFFVHPAEEFRRVQVNGYVAGSAHNLPHARRGEFEYVLQAHDETMVACCAVDAEKARARCSILYDPSGGKGARPLRWPRAAPGIRMGYAGGIGPVNVASVIAEIREVNGGGPPAWIDMEGGVRDARDRLDLAAVVVVLETASRLNKSDFQTG